MKLNEMNNSRKLNVKKALKEHYEVNLDFNKLNLKKTSDMLKNVRGLLAESRISKDYHRSRSSNSYMKLVMMEQALSNHYNDLKAHYQIMLENEEVQKSQVILAAQDMVDSVQKMVEQISKMKVEELPAVVTGISNEIGVNESEQFNTSVGEALGALEQSLTTAKSSLTSALGSITGEGGGGFSPAGSALDTAMPDQSTGEMPQAEEMPPEDEVSQEEPEEPVGGAGRGLR